MNEIIYIYIYIGIIIMEYFTMKMIIIHQYIMVIQKNYIYPKTWKNCNIPYKNFLLKEKYIYIYIR